MSLASVLRACAGDGAPSLSIQRGKGVAQDFVEAARLCRLAAAQGDAVAQHSLGVFYEYSRGYSRRASSAKSSGTPSPCS
jgi:TPR repeat protein